ncbi:MAG: GspH/FimT family protein [Chromatiales bacterium]|nr:GspH/FimT family protein [Chromatiales bacterium]
MDARKLSAAVEAIYSDVRYARSESIKCSQDTSITFADTAVAPATVWSSWQYSFPQCDGTVKTVTSTQFSVATVISIPATYTFNFVRGTANGGTITITADDGSSGTVTVSPIGRITSSY